MYRLKLAGFTLLLLGAGFVFFWPIGLLVVAALMAAAATIGPGPIILGLAGGLAVIVFSAPPESTSR